MKRPMQSVSGRCARRSVKVVGLGAMLAMVALVAGAKPPAIAAIPASEMQVLVTVEQAVQRFPGEVIRLMISR